MNKQELIKEYESIVKDDSLDLCGCYNMGDKIFMRKIYKSVLEDLEQLDEPQKIKLKDVIARIQKLDLGTQEVWLSEILNELGSDYGTLKYKDGYEQGKFDCAMEREKVTIPQFVADFIAEQKKLGHTLSYSIDASMSDRVAGWYWDNSELFARAWLDGYQTEKENRYIVKLKGINSESEYLYYGMGSCTWRFREKNESGYFRKEHTRKELEEAGFEEVFYSPMFEVKEVEE